MDTLQKLGYVLTLEEQFKSIEETMASEIELGEQKVQIGLELIRRLHAFKHIPGILKIQRKINTEILSLQKVMK